MNHDSEYRYTPQDPGHCPDHPACLLIGCHRFLCPHVHHCPLNYPGQPRLFCSAACRIAEHRRLQQ